MGFPWHVFLIPRISARLPRFAVSFCKLTILMCTGKFKVYALACIPRLPRKMEWEEVAQGYVQSQYSNVIPLNRAAPQPINDSNLALLLFN